VKRRGSFDQYFGPSLSPVWGLLAVFLLFGCANRVLQYEKAEQLAQIDEFDQKVKIGHAAIGTEASPSPESAKTVVSDGPPDGKSDATKLNPNQAVEKSPQTLEPHSAEIRKKKLSKKEKAALKAAEQEKERLAAESSVHQPLEVEGSEGFVGRRPVNDPFRVGERLVHEVSYIGMTAGKLALEVLPNIPVNGRQSYQFQLRAWSSSFFANYYNVDDLVTVLMDYEKLIPTAFTVHIKETKQLKEARSYFDHEKLQATYWERKVSEGEAPKEIKKEWEIATYSQNVFSAAFYLRVFPWVVGQEHAFRVADDGQNLIFKATALRKEELKTEAGTFDTIVIKPEVQLRGSAKPVGDIFVWLTDDSRHYIVRIESKIKIGTLVSEIVELVPGKP